MSWFQNLMRRLGFTILEPPALDYLQALARVPYVAGRMDCSNKARAYQLALIELGYDAQLVSVRTPRANHAVVHFHLPDAEMWADPTTGRYGEWRNLPWPINGIQPWFGDAAEYGTAGIDYGTWRATGKIAAADAEV